MARHEAQLCAWQLLALAELPELQKPQPSCAQWGLVGIRQGDSKALGSGLGIGRS